MPAVSSGNRAFYAFYRDQSNLTFCISSTFVVNIRIVYDFDMISNLDTVTAGSKQILVFTSPIPSIVHANNKAM